MAIDFLSSMGVGSGINTEEVVSALVEAQRASVQAGIDRDTKRAEATISGYGYVKSAIEQLRSAFDAIDDVRGIKSFSVSSSDSAAVSTTSNESAVPGSYDVVVSSLASRDVWTSNGFATTTESLNSGTAFDLTVNLGGSAQTVTVLAPTPQAVVDSINDAGLGLTAGIIDTGASGASRYIISVSGSTGVDNSFTLSSASADLTFPDQRSTAGDASLSIDGVAVTRAGNTVTNAIPGVTLNLNEVTSPDSINISVSRDINSLKDKLINLVDTYNDVETVFDTLISREDSEDGITGSLAGNTTFRYLKNQIRSLFTDESSTASGEYGYFASIGVEMTKSGQLEFNETQFTGAVADSFSDLVTMLTADTNDQSIYGDASRGLAGDAKVFLDKLLRVSGTVTTSIQRAEEQLSSYEEDLEDLNRRMEILRERYVAQFASMQQIVDQMSSTRDYLKQQFEALNSKD
jgi:flagellar hook-associated protein 2